MADLCTVVDQMGRCVRVPQFPQRIVSLVPSQTELLWALGLDEQVVGITKFCVHPPAWRKQKRIVGGTKNFQFERIHQLQPDLILGNKEENYPEGIETLAKSYAVWMSDITHISHALDMILQIGALVGRQSQAHKLHQGIVEAWQTIHQSACHLQKKALYLIWRNPYMAAGTHTFIHSVLSYLGFENACQLPRYPTINLADYAGSLVFLSSEPYPFQRKHIDEVKAHCQTDHVYLVDGEMFSWYGSRMLQAAKYFRQLIPALQQNLQSE